MDASKAAIGDATRSRLQRLGALYSDKDISSPIHRTEQQFHEGLSASGRPKTKFTKLAELAKEINDWEDDPSHPDYKHHRKTVYSNEKNNGNNSKKVTPVFAIKSNESTKQAVSPKKPVVSPRRIVQESKENPTSLNWDSRVMSQLESQGFKRRETTTTRLVYDYKNNSRDENSKLGKINETKAPDTSDAPSRYIEKREMPKEKPKVFSHISKPTRKSIYGKDPTELSLKVC